MALAEEAFSGIDLTETEAKRAYGKLSRDTYNKDIYSDVAAERHTLQLLSADFEYSEGLIWVYYTQEVLDRNGEAVTGNFQIEALWKLCQGEDGRWHDYEIKEHP